MADDVSATTQLSAPAPHWHAFTQLALVVLIFGTPWPMLKSGIQAGATPIWFAAARACCSTLGAFCRKVMELNFVRDQDISQPEQMVPIVAELGLSALGLTERAQSEPIKTRLRDQTEQARAKGIFGAPTFFVGTEMFWGNDRLDDALLFAAKQKV